MKEALKQGPYSNNNAKPSWFDVLVKNIITKITSFYNGKLVSFNLKTILPAGFSPLLLIVDRNFYQEFTITLPIDNKKDLKKVLSLEYPNVDGFFTYIHPSEQGQSSITVWKFSKAVPAAFIMLPESFLFTHALKLNHFIYSEINHVYFTRTSQGISSLPKNDLINSVEKFANASSTFVEYNTVISKDKYKGELFKSLISMKLQYFTCFMRPSNIPKIKQKLAVLLSTLFFVPMLYLFFTSIYLVINESMLETELKTQNKEVIKILEQQKKLDAKVLEYVEIERFIPSHPALTPVWNVLLDIFPAAKITRIQYYNNRFILRGSTEKATNILTILSEHPQVKDAKFDSPTSSYRKKERFVVSFKLTKKLATAVDDNTIQGEPNE